jgi:ribosome maturation factor RimP
MANLKLIKPIVEKKLAGMGIELYDIKFHAAGAGSVLKVYIDKDSGVTIADCETVSNELSMILDVEEFSSVSYRLEVSSPGADRLLKTEKDFLRVRGRNVCVQANDKNGKERPVIGIVEDCASGTLKLRTREELAEIPMSVVKYGKIEFSFK